MGRLESFLYEAIGVIHSPLRDPKGAYTDSGCQACERERRGFCSLHPGPQGHRGVLTPHPDLPLPLGSEPVAGRDSFSRREAALDIREQGTSETQRYRHIRREADRRPRREVLRAGPGSTTSRAILGSLRTFLCFWLSSGVLMRTRSPLWSTQVSLRDVGDPSGITVATFAKVLTSMSFLTDSGSGFIF